jgi:predicted transcriptional regulator
MAVKSLDPRIANRKPKRSFNEIRKSMLFELAKGQKTINDLAKSSDVNWKTTQNHLIYLVGMGYAREVFNSPYVRIFEITEKGEEQVKKLKLNIANRMKNSTKQI